LINAQHYSQFLIGITLLSFGDMLALTTTPAMINRFATDQNRATIQALGSTAGSLGRALGPLLGGVMIQLWNYQVTFIILFAVHLLFCLLGNWQLKANSLGKSEHLNM
jgi:MFS family permease